MGSCQSGDVIELKPEDDDYNYKEKKNSYSTDQIKSIEEQKKQFPDMKEWKGNRYSGIGIKKMKGYKCKLPIDKLNEKRQKFWDKRNQKGNQNYKVWRIINQACVYDEYRANLLLEQFQLTTASGCINHIIDRKGNHYFIPNYCINDPFFEKSFKIEDDIKQENIVINVFESSSNEKLELTVSNLLTGEELKHIIMKKMKISNKNFKIRLFYSGMEIKDNQFLYQHKIKKEYKIQIMKLPRIEDNVIDGKKV
jgi:hypothetical protein